MKATIETGQILLDFGMPYFPVFMNLEGKNVLVVGGGKVAARKVRALLSAQARVIVTARALGEELGALNDQGAIHWQMGEFQPEQVEGCWLVFAATDDKDLNQVVYETCERSGLPVNVVDNHELCRFISPAVVNRNPVQIAVSTGGTSPMLARAIRAWIEKLLPAGLGKISRVAGRLRKNIGAHFTLEERRRNWSFLADRSRIVRWSTEPAKTIEKYMRSEFKKREVQPQRGKVFLVGAGPGRPDLLTVRAMEALQLADVILHDQLVPEAILDQARRDADRVDVGKRAGRHKGVQARIFRLMVEAAKAGKTVVRLKGGDAFVFGRGGEELQHLKAHDIGYEVVPGITAALGCAAFAGIPLTHRDYAQQLTLATGHLAADTEGLTIDARRLSTASQLSLKAQGETLVVYMGVKQAARVRQQLLQSGTPGSTPAALIINGTMDAQRVLHGTVSTLPAMAAHVGNGAAGLFIVGKVAALGRELAWFGNAPAFEVAA